MNEAFERLLTLTGPQYVAARDELLKTEPDIDEASRTSDPKDWRVATHRAILRGWKDHRARYEEFLKRIAAVNVEKARRGLGGMSIVWQDFEDMARDKYGRDGLPLWWECVLKRRDEWPSAKMECVVFCLKGVPDDRSIDPLLSLLNDTPDEQHAKVVASVLSKLALPDLEARLGRVRERFPRAADRLGR